MDYPSNLLEIVVVDGMSNDKTKELVHELMTDFSNIKYIINTNLYTPHALNLGIQRASYQYIMIASAHSRFSKNYISELMRYLKLLECDGIGGILKTDVQNKTKKSLSIIKVLSNKFGVGNSKFRIGVNKPAKVDIVPFGIYKKSLFNEVGLYNETLIRNQDMEFSKRLITAKKNIYLIPTAVSTYFARESFVKLAKNNFGNGIWIPRTIYITKKFSSLSIRHFIPLLFLWSLTMPLLLSIWFPILGVISLFSLFCYLVVISIISNNINDKSTSIFYILGAFFTLHFSYAFGSIIGLININYLWIKRSDS